MLNKFKQLITMYKCSTKKMSKLWINVWELECIERFNIEKEYTQI